MVKLVAGPARADARHVTRAAKLKVAYFAQHQLDELEPERQPVRPRSPTDAGAPEAQVRARVGAIGFPGDAANTPVANLSGGEKARLLLALATFERRI